jgi:hypothetical protein
MRDFAMDPSRRSEIVLTESQLRNRRRRNIAIGLAVGFVAILFYVVTIVKVGPGVLQPMR